MTKRLLRLPGLFVLTATALSGAAAPPPVRWNLSCANREFFTVALVRNTLEGDLDGELALGTTEKVFYVPEVDPGFGLSVGYGQTRKNGMWMVTFTRSHHGAAFRGTASSASYNALEFGGKGYLWTRGPVLPYIQVGFGMPWLHVRDAAEREGVVSAANYLGLTVSGGGGLLVPLGARTFFTLGANYRFFAGMYAKGPGRGRDVTNLYIDRTGPRRDIFLKIPGVRLEAGFYYMF